MDNCLIWLKHWWSQAIREDKVQSKSSFPGASIHKLERFEVDDKTNNLGQDSPIQSRPSLVKRELYIHISPEQKQHKLTFTGFQYARKMKIMKQRRRKTSISIPIFKLTELLSFERNYKKRVLVQHGEIARAWMIDS